MSKGKIKKIMEKGFGFISPDDGGKDVFFHATNTSDLVEFNDLKEGDAVEFERKSGDRGPYADDVKFAG